MAIKHAAKWLVAAGRGWWQDNEMAAAVRKSAKAAVARQRENRDAAKSRVGKMS